MCYIELHVLNYSYSTTNKMHLLSQIIYSCKTLYMFWTVFSAIIRISKLRICSFEILMMAGKTARNM